MDCVISVVLAPGSLSALAMEDELNVTPLEETWDQEAGTGMHARYIWYILTRFVTHSKCKTLLLRLDGTSAL